MKLFIHTQKQKQLLMKATLKMYLNQSTLQLYQTENFLGKDSGWIIDSAVDHNINISKYNSLAASSYIKLPEELAHPRKGLINIQNIDYNEYFKRSLDKYLHPADHHTARITKADKEKKLDFKDIKFPVQVRDIHKIKKRILSALGFLVMKIRKNFQFMCQKML